jgi:hypothetical protein
LQRLSQRASPATAVRAGQLNASGEKEIAALIAGLPKRHCCAILRCTQARIIFSRRHRRCLRTLLIPG